MAEYKVLAAETAGAPWSNEHGQFQTYMLTLEDEAIPASLNQKIETPSPAIGAVMDLELTIDPAGRLKAKKVYKPGGGGGIGGGFSRSPEESAKIQRQHSQHMGLLYAAIRAEKEMLPEPFKLADLQKVIDWFDRDIAPATRQAAG